MTRLTSKKYRIDLYDIGKGFLLAIVTPVLVAIQDTLDAGMLTLDWKKLLMIGIGGGLAYLIKNFFSGEKLVSKR